MEAGYLHSWVELLHHHRQLLWYTLGGCWNGCPVDGGVSGLCTHKLNPRNLTLEGSGLEESKHVSESPRVPIFLTFAMARRLL